MLTRKRANQILENRNVSQNDATAQKVENKTIVSTKTYGKENATACSKNNKFDQLLQSPLSQKVSFKALSFWKQKADSLKSPEIRKKTGFEIYEYPTSDESPLYTKNGAPKKKRKNKKKNMKLGQRRKKLASDAIEKKQEWPAVLMKVNTLCVSPFRGPKIQVSLSTPLELHHSVQFDISERIGYPAEDSQNIGKRRRKYGNPSTSTSSSNQCITKSGGVVSPTHSVGFLTDLKCTAMPTRENDISPVPLDTNVQVSFPTPDRYKNCDSSSSSNHKNVTLRRRYDKPSSSLNSSDLHITTSGGVNSPAHSDTSDHVGLLTTDLKFTTLPTREKDVPPDMRKHYDSSSSVNASHKTVTLRRRYDNPSSSKIFKNVTIRRKYGNSSSGSSSNHYASLAAITLPTQDENEQDCRHAASNVKHVTKRASECDAFPSASLSNQLPTTQSASAIISTVSDLVMSTDANVEATTLPPLSRLSTSEPLVVSKYFQDHVSGTSVNGSSQDDLPRLTKKIVMTVDSEDYYRRGPIYEDTTLCHSQIANECGPDTSIYLTSGRDHVRARAIVQSLLSGKKKLEVHNDSFVATMDHKRGRNYSSLLNSICLAQIEHNLNATDLNQTFDGAKTKEGLLCSILESRKCYERKSLVKPRVSRVLNSTWRRETTLQAVGEEPSLHESFQPFESKLQGGIIEESSDDDSDFNKSNNSGHDLDAANLNQATFDGANAKEDSLCSIRESRKSCERISSVKPRRSRILNNTWKRETTLLAVGEEPSQCKSFQSKSFECKLQEGIIDESSEDGSDLNFSNNLTSYDLRVLELCNQEEPLPFSEYYNENTLINCKKIGEGSYGEVFAFDCPEEGKLVIKIIPIEGVVDYNDAPQKTYEEMFPEIVITKELSELRRSTLNRTDGFVELKYVRCVYGTFPDYLQQLWHDYDAAKKSDNDDPSILPDDQHYIIFALADAGKDLESFYFTNTNECEAALKQIVASFAVAEKALQFEHRDFHWGNVLLSRTAEPNITGILDGEQFVIPSDNIKVTIIDFTLSRIGLRGETFYNDLAADPTLFTTYGAEYQFEIYRMMREATKNQWDTFQPRTNIFWLHYTLKKMLDPRGVHFKRKPRIEKFKNLKEWESNILEFKDSLSVYKYLLMGYL